MKTAMKTLAIAIVAMIGSTIEASAQKIAAAAIVDQHYTSETNNYKFMMLVLGAAYGVYVILHNRRRKQMDRFLGKN
jgi:Ca2+/Na+ antiporter